MEKDQREACSGEENTKCREKPTHFDISSASIFELNGKASAGFVKKRTKPAPQWKNTGPVV